MNTSSTALTEDEILSIQTLPLKLILAGANELIDLNALAREELASRGLDLSGKWIGFDQARALLCR